MVKNMGDYYNFNSALKEMSDNFDGYKKFNEENDFYIEQNVKFLLEAIYPPYGSREEYEKQYDLLIELLKSLRNAKMYRKRKDEILRISYTIVTGYLNILKERKMLKGIYVQKKIADILGVSTGQIAKLQKRIIIPFKNKI